MGFSVRNILNSFVKMDEHMHMGYTKIDDDGDEYVKVDDYMEFDDDVEYVKVEYTVTVSDLENEYPLDDLENKDVDNDMENEDTEDDSENDDLENEDAYNDVEYKKRFTAHFAPTTKAVEIKDLVKDIVLPYLPAKSITRFRSVSKEWDEWIKSPFFAHQQSFYFKHLSGFFCQSSNMDPTFITLDKSAYGVPTSYLGSFLPENVNLLSSCNGLLFCRGRDAFDPYYLCNPATQDWTILPVPTLYPGYESTVVLAFKPSVLNMEANYRVLRAIPVDGCVFFDIYSSQTISWEVSRTVLVDMVDTRIKDNGFYMNGVVYMETSMRSVIAFDLISELYEVISLPFECPRDGVLTQVQGEVCYVGVSRIFHTNKYSIKIYAGMEMSLKRQVHIDIEAEAASEKFLRYRVLPCPDGDNVMILIEGGTIYCCSTSDGSVKVVSRVENGSAAAASARYLPYVNSLVHVAA